MQDEPRSRASEADRQSMEQDGFLVKRGFFSQAEIDEFLRWTEDLATAEEAPGKHWVYYEDSLTEPGKKVMQRIENFCPVHEGFNKLARDSALSRFTAELMGGPIKLFKDKINFKMPGGHGFKAHQDQAAGWDRYAPIFVTVLITLDAATVENGCLEMVAGKHKEGLLGAEWNPLNHDDLDYKLLPTAPGDIALFDSYAPHSSEPNKTDKPRRLLFFTYNLAEYGDHFAQYYADKHETFPPDIERDPSKSYKFRV